MYVLSSACRCAGEGLEKVRSSARTYRDTAVQTGKGKEGQDSGGSSLSDSPPSLLTGI